MKLKYEPVWKRFRKRTNGYFYPGAGHELHCSLRPVESVDNGESNSQGVALAENCLPSASNAGAKGIQVQFDAQVKSEESIIKIESAQTKKGSSESLNLIVPKEAEAKKPVTGLLKTTLDITPENDALKLDFSLQNIAEQDLSLSFSSSQKFDILITNQNGEEVYRWSHDKAFYGHCGC